jgi:flagellar assembly factor FliW
MGEAKMIVQTERFGEIEVREEDIIKFERGLPGFENSKLFTLIGVEEHAPFIYMQSLDQSQLVFIVVDPFEFFPQYEFDISDRVTEELAITSQEQATIRVIVSIKGNLESATANLVAPIVINKSSNLGKQVVLSTTPYTTKQSLFLVEKSK